MGGPLAGVRVLDVATFLAAPFCGTLLAELGAEVIKIEQPKTGDSLRMFGTRTECGDSLLWLSEARNKESVTLDLRRPEGAALFRRLAKVSDIVLENFRPGTLEAWGIGYEDLASVNPKLVMLRVSAYGQTGPLSSRPGFARIAHAFSGLAYLAGEPGRTPVVPGTTTLADYASGLFGAVGVLAALRHAESTGEGQVVDIGLYESIFRLLEEIAPAYGRYGIRRDPMGAETIHTAPHSHYRTRDGQWVALACSNDRMWRRLTRAMGQPEIGESERFATPISRVEHRAEVNSLVGGWVASLDCADVIKACESAETPCSKLLNIAEIFEHPHYIARGNLQTMTNARAGSLVVPAPVPRLSRTPSSLKSLGPALGNANRAVFGTLLETSDQEMNRLEAAGVI